MPDAKREDFERMWNTDNKAKRTQFQNYLRNKLLQIRMPFTVDNARAYWMGELKAPPPREEYRPEFEERRGPPPRRRGPPRRGGPSRGRR